MRAEDKNSLKNNYNPNLRLSAAKLLSLAGVRIRAQKEVAGREWKNMFPGRDEEAERRRRGLWTPPSSEASGGKGERCEKEERREKKRRRGNGSLTQWNFWTTTTSISQSHYFFSFFSVGGWSAPGCLPLLCAEVSHTLCLILPGLSHKCCTHCFPL